MDAAGGFRRPDGASPGRGGRRPRWRFEFQTAGELETKRIAGTMGAIARDGWVVLLTGPLGAGKTAFAQGLLAGLGVTGRVRSPTFTIINEYPGRLTAWHADLYRLEGGEAFAALGGDELLLGGEGLVVVEWAEKLGPGFVPADRASVELSFVSRRGPDDRRLVSVALSGDAYAGAAEALSRLRLPGPASGRDGP